jgi:hypothetical protein
MTRSYSCRALDGPAQNRQNRKLARRASEAAATRAVLDLSCGAITEEGFAHWLEDNIDRT